LVDYKIIIGLKTAQLGTFLQKHLSHFHVGYWCLCAHTMNVTFKYKSVNILNVLRCWNIYTYCGHSKAPTVNEGKFESQTWQNL